MPSYLDFNSTKKFRDYILGKTLNVPNGPQTFSDTSFSVKSLNDMANKDTGDVILNDATSAITNLVIFLAAATRIAPAILRIQQSLLILRGGLGTVANTIKIIKEASVGENQELQDSTPDFNYLDFNNSIVIKNLQFAYGKYRHLRKLWGWENYTS